MSYEIIYTKELVMGKENKVAIIRIMYNRRDFKNQTFFEIRALLRRCLFHANFKRDALL